MGNRMATSNSIDVAKHAQSIYQERLRARLEASHPDEFVAIEPQSGDYFLGKILSEAIQAARAVHPDRLPFTLRIGHPATVELGVICP
jgi:hypothetical protein